jgi:hypothetical protein
MWVGEVDATAFVLFVVFVLAVLCCRIVSLFYFINQLVLYILFPISNVSVYRFLMMITAMFLTLMLMVIKVVLVVGTVE